MALRFCLIAICFFSLPLNLFSQNANEEPVSVEESINELKMSNMYYIAEAFDRTINLATKTCYRKLLNDINKYRKELNLKEAEPQQMIASMKTLQEKKESGYRVFAYIERAVAEKKDPIDRSDIFVTEPVKIISTNASATQMEVPSIIDRLLHTDTYTNADWLLNNAKNKGQITSFAKYKQMDKPDICYLLIINKEMKIVTILSPITNDTRKDVRNGEMADFKQYMDCAVICIKI